MLIKFSFLISFKILSFPPLSTIIVFIFFKVLRLFKRLLELDQDDYRSTEYRWMGGASQEELREKYK
jgi:hypothetical protein